MKRMLIFLILFSTLFPNREINRTKKDQVPAHHYYSRNIVQDESDLIEYIESVMEGSLIPGISASIIKNNEVVWDFYGGYANIDDNILVSDETMFSLASVSKTVTATALMQLWEEGLFELDNDIDAFLPFNVNHPDFPFTPITFKMLLTHTSGIQDNWNVMPYYDGDPELELGYYLEEYLVPGGLFYSSNSSFTNSLPGNQYRYSNIGVALIGYLVEVISGQPFNEYCNENIFVPLGMENTAWFLNEIDDLSQVAYPYSLAGGSGNTCYDIGCGIYNESNPCFCDSECIYYNDCCSDYDEVCGENGSGSGDGAITFEPLNHYGYADYPSGQLRTTAGDLGKLLSAYMAGGTYNGIYILSSETIELIQTAPFPDLEPMQGLIWYYKNVNNRTLFGHNGGDLGSLTEMFMSINDQLGVIVLTNSSSYSAVIAIENALFDFAEETSFETLGDVNQDGITNIQDVIIAINFILEGIYNTTADINSDYDVNIQDIILLVNIILSFNSL